MEGSQQKREKKLIMKVFVTRSRASFPSEAMDLLEKSCQVTYWKDNSVISKDGLIGMCMNKKLTEPMMSCYFYF